VIRTRIAANVNIGTVRHKLAASLSVEDNGPGVPPEIADTIFFPLVTGRANGTGLGLAVSQDLVTRHGGLIEFESKPGRTVFNILLPLPENA
jgi:two-component system nitrogen regulation sensor histidine kinase GlnL